MKKSIVSLLVSLATSTLVTAQVSGPRAEPANPDIRVSPATYSSAFSQYRRLSDESVARWKDTNETVEKIGGWRVYLKEGRQTEPAASPQPAAADRPGDKAK